MIGIRVHPGDDAPCDDYPNINAEKKVYQLKK